MKKDKTTNPKKEKPKKTIGEWISYTLVSIIVFIFTWGLCDILINGNNWYMANVNTDDIYSISINYVDKEKNYDNILYLDDPKYKDTSIDMLYFINNRTPHNSIAQCILRNKEKLLNLNKLINISGNNFSTEFNVIITTKDEVEKTVAFSKENKQEFIDYILNDENSVAKEIYKLE